MAFQTKRQHHKHPKKEQRSWYVEEEAEEKKIFYLMPAEMRCCPLLLIAHFLGACHPQVRRRFKNTPTASPFSNINISIYNQKGYKLALIHELLKLKSSNHQDH